MRFVIRDLRCDQLFELGFMETRVDPDQENQGYNLRAPQGNLRNKHFSDPGGGGKGKVRF